MKTPIDSGQCLPLMVALQTYPAMKELTNQYRFKKYATVYPQLVLSSIFLKIGPTCGVKFDPA
jgi:hypothetical protein